MQSKGNNLLEYMLCASDFATWFSCIALIHLRQSQYYFLISTKEIEHKEVQWHVHVMQPRKSRTDI
jgi:hypothetical protein